MPSRLIREGILTSDRVNELDAAAEVFYRRLMSKVDDHGLFDARPSVLRSSLYPLRVDRVREADITRWIAACEKAGVIALYVHDGKPYGQMVDTRWSVRSEPKHPMPPWGNEAPPERQEPSSENTCKQVQTVANLDVVVVEDDKKHTSASPPGSRFDEFWGTWPQSARKVGKAKCLDHWKRHKLDDLADQIIAHVRIMKNTSQWQTGYEPAPMTYLNGKRWLDGVPVERGAQHPVVNGCVQVSGDWWESNAGITAKGKEFGLRESQFDNWVYFRAEVLKRAGHGPWSRQ